MKRLNFSSLSLICFSLFSMNVYAQNNFIHAKDSVDIGTFSNCNNFIVHKENITVEGCPIGKGNSYVGEKGFGTYLGKFVGLNKRIELDNNNYQQQKIGGNTRYFSKISTSAPICYFKGKQFAHYDESTSEIHRLIKPRVSEITYTNCYNKCDRLTPDNNEYERKLQCPSGDGFFTQKYKKVLNIPSHIALKDNNKYIKPQDCSLITEDEHIISTDQMSVCLPAIPSDISTVCQKVSDKDYVLSIGTIGNDYWGDGVYDRRLNFKNLLKTKCGLDLFNEVEKLYVEKVQMDDWLEIKANNKSYYSFPFVQYKFLELCPNQRSSIRWSKVCHSNQEYTGRSVEMSVSWNISTTRAHGPAPKIQEKNILPLLNEENSNVDFRTFVGGRGEFYSLFRIKAK